MVEPGQGKAGRLRNALVDQLRAENAVRGERVEAALRAVPRHLFVPDVPLRRAYANDVVSVKLDTSSVPISAASQPSIVALMLEQLAAGPGMRVLEIGTGTGYNAALLAHLVGESGSVTTIEVDDDIVAAARRSLAAAGCPDVEVVRGDGALGYAGRAPYDRIIATVGAWDLPLAWLRQLAPGGRLVVPLRIRGSITRSIAFERGSGDGPGGDGPGGGQPDSWHSVSSEACSFMPLRDGIADDPRRVISLTGDAGVTLAVHQDQVADERSLRGVLGLPRHEVWTGVSPPGGYSIGWLYLWLACALPGALFRMNVQPGAVDEGLVTPMFSWGSMAVVDSSSLVYLAFRPPARTVPRPAPQPPVPRPAPQPVAGTETETQSTPGPASGWHEIGVIGHGPRGGELAAEVAAVIRTWDDRYRTRAARFTLRPAPAGPQPPALRPGTFTFRMPRTQLTIEWQ